MRKLAGILLCLVGPSWLPLMLLEQQLLDSRVLNTKDLPPFIGQDSGTVSDYLLNVWHWDAVLFLMMVAGIPCLVIGIRILKSLAEQETPKKAHPTATLNRQSR